MQFCDALQFGTPRRTKDGYLAVRARSARTGVYHYAGREIDPENKHGLRDQATVNVLRDDATVFDERAARSFVGKPITVDHPSEPVTAANWKDHSRGAIMGALRDGDYLAFDLLLMDAGAIADVEAGKRELSNGYAAEIEFGDFTAADGTKCQARQDRITDGNHVAIVKAGRAGPECRISDGGKALFQNCDAVPVILADGLEEKPVKTYPLDGLPINLDDASQVEAGFRKLEAKLADAATAADKAAADLADERAKVATLTTEKATLDAKVTTLETQLADSRLTPQALRDAAKAFAEVVDKAKALGVTVSDDMDEPAIMKAAVSARLGDRAKDWDAAQVAISFATLTADVKPGQGLQPLRIVAGDGATREVRTAYDEMVADLTGTKTAAA